MPNVIAKGRNPIIAAAWAGLEAQRKADAKKKPAAEPAEPADRKQKARAAMETVAKPVLKAAKKPTKVAAKRAPAKKATARKGKA